MVEPVPFLLWNGSWDPSADLVERQSVPVPAVPDLILRLETAKDDAAAVASMGHVAAVVVESRPVGHRLWSGHAAHNVVDTG